MNVKFKMPKFGRHLTGGTMAKEILMTVIGTTISIVLTFGTAGWLERKQMKISGRQTAMMVILDIDESVKAMKELAKWEDDNFKVAQYVMGRLQELDSLSEDTLYMVYNFFCQGDQMMFDDSREKIFHSSQESWKNINNPQFIDVVQQFYYSRRQQQEYRNTHYLFREPLSKDEQYAYLLTSPDQSITTILPEVLPKVYADPKTKIFLDYSPRRQMYYNTVADEWKNMGNQCRFLMGITNEELQKYVEKSEHTGSRASKRQLTGTWTADVSEAIEEITFRRDGTLTHTNIMEIPAHFYTGSLKRSIFMEGTWSIEGDSLVRRYPLAAQRYEIDKSGVSINDDATREDAERYISEWETTIAQYNEQMSADTTVLIRTNAAYIDDTGDMIELNSVSVDENGEVKNTKIYMIRKKE